MALELDSRYPGRFNPGDADYPQGSFKNRTAPGALDGSYLEKDWANDKEGFFQRLMLEAGISANGVVDTALASQYYDALIQTINDQVAVPSNILTSGIQGSFSNLKASATGLSALVTVTADSICLKNPANEQVVLNAVSVSPSLVASGANGLDTGVSVANTWYSVWVIWNGTTTAGLLSLSGTSPTMPGGYTHKARVGWIRSDSTSNKYPLGFTQNGKSIDLKIGSGTNLTAFPIMASGVAGNADTPTFVSVSVSNFVPPGAGIIKVRTTRIVAISRVVVAPNASYGTPDSDTRAAAPIAVSGTSSFGITPSANITLESGNIFWANGISSLALLCTGWEDNL